MTGLSVLLGLTLGLAAVAGFLLAGAVLVRALATLLPPVGQFLGDLQQVRDWSAHRAEERARRPRAAPAPDEGTPTRPTGPLPGIAPEPVFEGSPSSARPIEPSGPTSAKIPTIPIGDLDRFEALALVEDLPGERPLAPRSKGAARPPGPPVEGEEGYPG